MSKELALKNTSEEIALKGKSSIIMEYVRTGDVSMMTVEQKNELIIAVCQHLSLDPSMKPIDIIPTAAGEKLYINAVGTNMIAVTRGLSRQIKDLEFRFDNTIAILHAEVTDKTRIETGFAAVTIGKFEAGKFVQQRGEELANTLMKLQTKALRRATLAFAGAPDIGVYNEIVDDKLTAIDTSLSGVIPEVGRKKEEEIKVEAPSFISGKEVDADIEEPKKPTKNIVQDSEKDYLNEKAQEAYKKSQELVAEIETKTDYEQLAKDKIKEYFGTQKAFKEKTGMSKKDAEKWLEDGKCFSELLEEQGVVPKTKQEEKLEKGKELEQKNEKLAEEIKEEYSLDSDDGDAFSMEIDVNYEKFDGRNKKHLPIFLSVLDDILGKGWKQNNQEAVVFVQKTLMPELHEKEDFLVAGTAEVKQEFIALAVKRLKESGF